MYYQLPSPEKAETDSKICENKGFCYALTFKFLLVQVKIIITIKIIII